MKRVGWSPYRWHRNGRLCVALIVATFVCFSLAVLVTRQPPAGAIPQGSTPDLYVTGSQEASLFSFGNDTPGNQTASQPGQGLKGVADTSDGTHTVIIGRHSHTPMAFVVDPATGAKVGSIAFPGQPLVGVAADPRHPDLVFVASENALYSVNVLTLNTHSVFALPKSTKDTFTSLAIAPNGARAYLGGANSNTGSPVNAIVTVKLEGTPTTSQWVAPATDRYFAGDVTDLALTPDGKELFATNSSSLSSTVAPTTTTTHAAVPTMLTVTGVYAPNIGQIQWNWTANDNGSPITNWVLTVSFNGSVLTQTKIAGAPNYATGVGCGGGAWTLQVAAINSVGQSAPLTSSPVNVQPNCSTQPATTSSTSSPSTSTTQATTTPSSSSTGCGLTCISRTIICLICRITTTTAPIIQGPELGPASSAPESGSSPPLAQPVSQNGSNAPSARLLLDAVAFGFHIPFHTGPGPNRYNHYHRRGRFRP